jgi:hypothetical protein
MPTSRRVTYRVPLLYNAIELHATMLALTSAEEAVLKRLVNLKLRRIWYWLEILRIWQIAPPMPPERLRSISEISLMSGVTITIKVAVLELANVHTSFHWVIKALA